MRIVFKKIPKLAIFFYLTGFIVLLISMLLAFYIPNTVNPITIKQIFIGGAIIIVIGSVINSVYQFNPKKSTKKE